MCYRCAQGKNSENAHRRHFPVAKDAVFKYLQIIDSDDRPNCNACWQRTDSQECGCFGEREQHNNVDSCGSRGDDA